MIYTYDFVILLVIFVNGAYMHKCISMHTCTCKLLLSSTYEYIHVWILVLSRVVDWTPYLRITKVCIGQVWTISLVYCILHDKLYPLVNG